MAYWEEEVRSLFGRAIHRYGLVGPGDRVAVGLSGGKDSLSLLWLLAERRRRLRAVFELVAVWVDLGLAGVDGPALDSFCAGLGVELVRLAAGPSPEELGGCYPCARLRRRRLFEAADRAGCGLVALGHHLDDLVETYLLNLLLHGRAETFRPAEEFHRGRFKVIRPLFLIPEARLARLARRLSLPVQPHDCPVGRSSARARLKAELPGLYRLHRRARQNLLKAALGPEPRPEVLDVAPLPFHRPPPEG
jgi:tRNA 2-thiocytidine biosynthesis protein TtcA